MSSDMLKLLKLCSANVPSDTVQNLCRMLSALCQANVKWQSANVTSNKVQIALKQKKCKYQSNFQVLFK